MASKWAKLAGKFPVKVESENRDKINKCKADLESHSEIEIVQFYKRIGEEKNTIEERLKDINVLKQAITEVIIDRWAKEGKGDLGSGITEKAFQGIGKLIIMLKPYCQFKDIQGLKPYLSKHGMSQLIKEEISWQAGNSFISDQLENGKELPSTEQVTIFIKKDLRLYKEK